MKKPFEIVVLSGKGGTGKTSLTASFASLAKNAVFADCDVDAADLHLILSPRIIRQENFESGAKAKIDLHKCTNCGLCADLCRFNAIETDKGLIHIDEYACEGCGLCLAYCPSAAITIEKAEKNQLIMADSRFGPMIYGKLGIAEENSGKLVSKIRQYAKSTALEFGHDCIIIDGPPGIGCPVISSVTGSDLVVAVTEPTLSGWHDLGRLIEMAGHFKTPVNVIINKFDLNDEMTSTIEKKLYEKRIAVLGRIPYDESVIYALLEGRTIREHDPSGPVAVEIKRIWNLITNNSNIYESESL